MKKKILFLCGHNAGRSQMAQAYFNKYNTNENFVGLSAGTNIADQVNSACIEAMKEEGVDMNDSSNFFPKVIDEDENYYRIYSMGCNVKSELAIYDDLGIDDPAGQEGENIKIIRNQVKENIIAIIDDLNQNATN
ncbi:hypothetical protein PQO03_21850 [Lentisphaera profundi]|uniref:Phosphotyrosine protein phosphatase I domain-containing protein n=1 Tax=Lentisphaera profundi TaxID=1658616 RepID=A0ABY7W2E7_9BACT|nr:hypothetical protein [Lentisphaera profundi]WDE98458.1 hypothetical protein PQO03_21850 [Lentisphaera profundi]